MTATNSDHAQRLIAEAATASRRRESLLAAAEALTATPTIAEARDALAQETGISPVIATDAMAILRRLRT